VQDAPRLGGIPGAVIVSNFTQGVANDGRGIVLAVQGLQETISQMRDAYQQAVANYQAIELHVADSVSKFALEVQQQNAPAPQHSRVRAE
jgi:hypothetical protein